MGFGLKRTTLQGVAQAKFDDAFILMKHHRFSNAYYLAGFAIEIALKACIAKRFEADTIPDKALVADLYIHDLRKLVNVAGLKSDLDTTERADSSFSAHWAIVCEWKPDVRYDSVDAISTQIMMASVHEVFEWIRARW